MIALTPPSIAACSALISSPSELLWAVWRRMFLQKASLIKILLISDSVRPPYNSISLTPRRFKLGPFNNNIFFINLRKIGVQYKDYGVTGRPISHSLSIVVHGIFSLQTKLLAQYNRYLALDDKLGGLVGRLMSKGGGVNITAPFKNQAYRFCQFTSCRARTSVSVNTLKFYNGKCYGDSTDGVGLVRDIKSKSLALSNATIIILGSGGSVSSMLFNILNEGPKHVSILARNKRRLASIFGEVKQYIYRTPTALAFGLLNQFQEPCADILISTIPVNFFQIRRPVGRNCGIKLAYDIKYQPRLTDFMISSIEHGVKISNGLGMLIRQASESYRVWSSKRVNNNILERTVHSFISSQWRLESGASNLSVARAHFGGAKSVQDS